jgi:hypothetical protein
MEVLVNHLLHSLADITVLVGVLAFTAVAAVTLVWLAAYLRENPGSATAVAASVVEKITGNPNRDKATKRAVLGNPDTGTTSGVKQPVRSSTN